VKAINDRWRTAHPEESRAACRDSYWRNIDENRARMRQWQRDNPDAAKALNHRRRARKMGAEGSYTAADVAVILEAQGWICVGPLCGADLRSGYTVDHKVPLTRGGSNWPANLQALCKPCNCSKNDRTMDEWRGRHDLLKGEPYHA
jgi:5-methylcytosine-specific restriction endonuclease McrA